eukprot:6994574-Pyramimonas_sp.AAC.1
MAHRSRNGLGPDQAKGKPLDLGRAVMTTGPHQQMAARVVHQTSFRHCINRALTPLTPQEGARLIVLGLEIPDHIEQAEEHESIPPPAREGQDAETAVWAPMEDNCAA